VDQFVTTRQNLAAPIMAREAITRWVLGAVLVTTAVLVVVLLAGGGAPQPVPVGLPDAGPITGWGLPLVRLAADLLGIVTLGLLLAAAFLLPSPAAGLADLPARATIWAGRTATAWLVVVGVEVVLTVSDILGLPPGTVLEPTLLRSFLGQTSQGRGLLIQGALVVVVAGLARSSQTTRGAAVSMLVALAALAPPGLTGHAASAGSHELAGRWTGGAGLGGAGWHRRPALCRPTVLDTGRLVLRDRRRQRRDQCSGAPGWSKAALHIRVWRPGAGQGRGAGGARWFRLVAPAAHRRGSKRPGRHGQRSA
jgi:hypothetical protein